MLLDCVRKVNFEATKLPMSKAAERCRSQADASRRPLIAGACYRRRYSCRTVTTTNPSHSTVPCTTTPSTT
jgi:hypothetical protein